MNQAMTELSNLLSVIDDEFYYVNHGGCGCVAAMLATALRHVFPIMSVRTCGAYYEDIDIDDIRNKLENNLCKQEWSDNGIYFAHLWVEILYKGEWYAVDSTGVQPVEYMYEEWGKPVNGSFTFEEIHALAATDSWNPEFDRDQLPGIQATIDQQLQHYSV